MGIPRKLFLNMVPVLPWIKSPPALTGSVDLSSEDENMYKSIYAVHVGKIRITRLAISSSFRDFQDLECSYNNLRGIDLELQGKMRNKLPYSHPIMIETV